MIHTRTPISSQNQTIQLRPAPLVVSRHTRRGLPALACSCVFLFAHSALAQEKPTLNNLDSRLNRIERVMDQSLLEQLQRIDALQQEIRGLRGEIENLNYELETLTKRNSDLYADTDRRITDLEEAQDSLGLLGRRRWPGRKWSAGRDGRRPG